jgi:hypothetical protein
MGSDRVLVTGGPWKERLGCNGRIVEFTPSPQFPNITYPWAGLAAGEVVVLLDDDPLDEAPGEPRTWSCVLSREAVIILN